MIIYICIYNHLFIQEVYAQLQSGKDLEGWINKEKVHEPNCPVAT